MHPLFLNLETTIFSEMSALAAEHGAINLGQGFPEVDGAPEVRAAAARALIERSNQYAPTQGVPELRAAIAEHYGRHDGVTLDPLQEVMVTSGATEALAAAFLALVCPGDEVVCFEPLFDAYVPLIERAGGVVRVGRLQAPDFRLTAELLERTLTPRTRLVVLNTPHNPGASVLDPSELEPLVRHVERYGSRIISDEVWERITFDGARHHSVLSVPALRHSVVKIGSGGKMFALTGWKIGLVCAAPELLRVLSRAHQFLTFATPPALQHAVAEGLAYAPEYFQASAAALQKSRDLLAARLQAAGIAVLPTAGTYFQNIDLRASGVSLDDRAFAQRAVREFGVATIPLSPFYLSGPNQPEEPPRHFVRLCFAKQDQTLETGAARLCEAMDALRGCALRG